MENKIELYCLLSVLIAMLIGMLFFVSHVRAEEYNIYKRNPYTGVQDIFPDKTIVVKPDRIEVYKNGQYGLREWQPEITIEKSPSTRRRDYRDRQRTTWPRPRSDRRQLQPIREW